jgi:MoaE-MoaD fusion protein
MTVAVRVEVLLFARLRELAGASAVVVAPAPVDGGGAVTARDVWTAVCAQHPRLVGADVGLRVAVNQAYAAWDAPVGEGDTVAFIPPVAGGSGRPSVHVAVTTEPLDARAVEQLVRSDADGAVCTFTGVVRDHADGHPVTHLDYEAYQSMAEARLRAICEEAVRRFGATAVAAVHRTGTLQIGEASVVVAASAPHRGTAFDACRYTIDTLKADAPIWKKEHGPGGAVWVDETQRGH